MKSLKQLLVLCISLISVSLFAQNAELKITRATINSSKTTVTVAFAMNNSAEIGSFQYCVSVPDGMTYSASSLYTGTRAEYIEQVEDEETEEMVDVTKNMLSISPKDFTKYVKVVVNCEIGKKLPKNESDQELFRMTFKTNGAEFNEKAFILSNVKGGGVPTRYLAGYLGTNGYSSFSSSFGVEFEDGITAYFGTLDGDVITLSPATGNQVPKENGVILKGAKAGDPIYAIQRNEVSEALSSDLTPSLNGVEAQDVHVLTTEDGVTGFYKYSGYIPCGKAYLENAPAKVSVRFADETGIEEISAEDLNGVIFNLNGQKVNEAKKGIHVVNGKKVMF